MVEAVAFHHEPEATGAGPGDLLALVQRADREAHAQAAGDAVVAVRAG